MWLCSLCVVVVVGVCAEAWKTEYTATGREEGDVCHRQNGEEWTCRTNCETLKDVLKENGKLRTCSWKDRSPILCCPPKSDYERIKISKSEEKCSEYAKLLCSQDFLPFASASRPAATLQRKRREDSESTTETAEVGVFPAVAGGIPTLPAEFPSMIPDIDQRSEEKESNQPFEGNTRRPVLSILGGHYTLPAEFPSMVGVKRPKRMNSRPNIIGGIKARPKDNPHMALIGYGDAGNINWQCGGSLISENYVLSAAHCVNTPYGLARWVRLGDLDLKSDTEDARPQQLEIVERVVHPAYRSPTFYNDLALFRLERNVGFDRYVRPACLHSDVRDPSGRGTAAGWGKNETHGPRSSQLMQVDISFVPAQECKRLVGVINKYLPNGLDTDTMVCAGELGKDTCQGDSGGPLVLPATPFAPRDCLARLVGVTSFGPRNCGMTSVPGAYVRVAHFLSWIESIVWPE